MADALGGAILATLEDRPDGATEPSPLDLVRVTAEAERVARDLLQGAVSSARGAGHSWGAIGGVLNLSRQAVQQRFGDKASAEAEADHADERWLGPVSAFDEMDELDLAGRSGWHTVEAGMLRHRMVRTDTQWEHRRVLWPGSAERYLRDGWQVGTRAFPWLYLIRDRAIPADSAAS